MHTSINHDKRPTRSCAPQQALYAFAPSSPVPTRELETGTPDALEILVFWGDTVLHVVHQNPARGFTVGEGAADGSPADFLIPSERLGFTLLPVVSVVAGEVRLCVPARAQGYLEDAARVRTSWDALRGSAEPEVQVPGARSIALPLGARARLELGLFTVQIASVTAAKAPRAGLGEWLDQRVGYALLGSFALVGAFLGVVAYYVPPIGLEPDEGARDDQVRLIQQYLATSAERSRELAHDDSPNQSSSPQAGQSGARAPGEDGKAGSVNVRNRSGRMAVKGTPDEPNPHLSRAQALDEARHFGINDLLGSMNALSGATPFNALGDLTAVGRDPLSAMGNLWSDELGEGSGSGGLGLTGTGSGGGCKGANCGAGYGIDTVGTMGGGLGTCDPKTGPCTGMGRGTGHGIGHGQGSHKTRVPQIRTPSVDVSGRLPPEVIQRIVRQNYGRFRFCYEKGLAGNPSLAGRVGVRFVIGRDGAVSNVSESGSDLQNSTVSSCVIQSFYGLSFPAPEGGIVTVSYPIQFQPG